MSPNLHFDLSSDIWEQDQAEAHWQELVRSRLQERVVPVKRSRAAAIGDEREIARTIRDLPRHERAARWRGLTAKSEKELYRRLAEL